ncbi:hypothetical protein D8M04_19400 [Oceanobacillus piezotolerans]|uniref:Uncharacterized protein n=1 Tax=Oceanobacillus piezotolerans TaxID=2448030 RepID=A0A498DHF7_9BACI|nr:hypothetical protein D8M04_19400 [Oceanobacillus piezotolerans]
MIITGKKIGFFVGWLAFITSMFGIISNVWLEIEYSYLAIGTGLLSSLILLVLCSNKNNDNRQNEV